MDRYRDFADQELVDLLKQGDHDAFTEIYARHAAKILYQVKQMLRDDDAAKDIIQELFVRIWERAENIRPGADLKGYLYVAARNAVFQFIKKGKVKNDYLASLSGFCNELNAGEQIVFDEEEIYARIDAEIAILPEKMRAVFELSRKAQLSYRQIAEELGITEHTVKSQVSNALRILRLKLNGHAPASIIIIALLKK